MLGRCELDLVHVWPKFWHGVDFRHPPSMAACNKGVHPHPATCSLSRSLSAMQRMIFDIIYIHFFGSLKVSNCSSSSLVWLGLASSYPINTIRQLFTDRAAPPALKVTAPTGIQVVAANIRHGSRIFSLLSILFHMLMDASFAFRRRWWTSGCSSLMNAHF